MSLQKIATKQIGQLTFFLGMLLALTTAFIPLGPWSNQLLLLLACLTGFFHEKTKNHLLTLGIIYLGLTTASDGLDTLIWFGPLITKLIAAWVAFLKPIVIITFMVWGTPFLLTNDTKSRA
ncbi:MAG TPA: hypothetical protein VLL52_10695 [Anaerolineae bacterium]|nr:hypothetical protein [Anaerolineae bacterium]